jgi:TolA-binding protein
LAQETPESRAFKVAAGFFGLRVYDRAEREFQQFVQTYPQSPMLPEAILLQARAAMEQTNMASAIRLLSANVAKAGPLADQYLYRLASARMVESVPR